jgi:hypothetical protein
MTTPDRHAVAAACGLFLIILGALAGIALLLRAIFRKEEKLGVLGILFVVGVSSGLLVTLQFT